jgi:hypothetical protein
MWQLILDEKTVPSLVRNEHGRYRDEH